MIKEKELGRQRRREEGLWDTSTITIARHHVCAVRKSLKYVCRIALVAVPAAAQV